MIFVMRVAMLIPVRPPTSNGIIAKVRFANSDEMDFEPLTSLVWIRPSSPSS